MKRWDKKKEGTIEKKKGGKKTGVRVTGTTIERVTLHGLVPPRA